MEQEAIDSTLEVCFNSNYFCKLKEYISNQKIIMIILKIKFIKRWLMT